MEMTASSADRDVQAANHPREYRLFWALDYDGDGSVQTDRKSVV